MAQTLKIGGTLTLVLEDAEPSKAGIYIEIRYDQFKLKARGDKMAYTLPGDKAALVQVSYVDANGNPAAVDGEVAWSSSDDTIAAAVTDTADSTQCKVVPGTKVGQVQITATADADLGEGTRALICFMDVTVVGGEAVGGTIMPVGAPVPKA